MCRHPHLEHGRYPEDGWVVWWARCADCGAHRYERHPPGRDVGRLTLSPLAPWEKPLTAPHWPVNGVGVKIGRETG